MKKLLLASLALAALATAGAAVAADMPTAPVYKAPPPVVVYSWTGFYVGANLGYSWGRATNDWNFYATGPFSNPACFPPPGGSFCANGADSNKLEGAISGLQAGHNWQTGNVLLGIETDFQISAQKGDQVFIANFSNAGSPAVGTAAAAYTEKLRWLGTLRGRVGFTADRLLVYATGGLAYGGVTIKGSAAASGASASCGGFTALPCVPIGSWSNGTTKAGWTIGAGAEGAITNNLSLKVEYLHVDLGNVGTAFAIPPGGCIGSVGGCTFYVGGTGTINSKITDEIVRVGINYKFGGPVYANY